ADAPALITFTSGSTGLPKAALRTHGFLLEQYRVLAQHLQPQVGAIELNILPIFILANLAAGQSSLIPTGNLRKLGQIRAKPILRQIEQERPTRLLASPGFLERLIDYCQHHQQTLTTVQTIFCGGAPMTPLLLDQLQAIAPNASIQLIYGATEAEPIAHLAAQMMTQADREQTQRGGGLLAGYPVPELRVRVIRQQWGQPIANWKAQDLQANTLPVDAIGEIIVSGDHVLSQYLPTPEALAALGPNTQANMQLDHNQLTKFRVKHQVWHRTGDAGYFDQQGRLWLVGRCQARVEGDRGCLYPLQVESVANQISGVRRTTLLSANLSGRGPHRQQRILLIELHKRRQHPWSQRLRLQTQAEILEKLATTLAWARLDRIIICRQIPVDRRHNAKIDYKRLRHTPCVRC
ncbi:MAG: AMP-binding protein, partial [Cyanobacteria bacterium P01_H01_bin.121]